VRKATHETADISVNLSASSVDGRKVSSSKSTQDTHPDQSFVDPLRQLSTSEHTRDTHPGKYGSARDTHPGQYGGARDDVCDSPVNHLEQKGVNLSTGIHSAIQQKGLDSSTALRPAVQHCDVCGKQVPVSNWSLHTLRCSVEPANRSSQVSHSSFIH